MLYRTLFSTAYFRLFRVSEVTSGAHPVLAKDVHIGSNKNKVLFVLSSSKTHLSSMPPQLVKITSNNNTSESKQESKESLSLPCPFNLLRLYADARGGFLTDAEPFFVFRDHSPVTAHHMSLCLKLILQKSGFDSKFYGTHSLRSGRSCDLYKEFLLKTSKNLGGGNRIQFSGT